MSDPYYDIKQHWYWFVFDYKGYKSTYINGFNEKRVSLCDIQDAKIFSAPDGAVLLSLTYLGYQTEFQLRED